MSQYAIGTVSVSNGGTFVDGHGTAWLANVQAGDLLTIRGTGVAYEVAGVGANNSLTLTAPYGGATGAFVDYVISRSFTPTFRIPFPEIRDLEAVTILKRAILAIETLLSRANQPTLVVRTTNTTLVSGDDGAIIKCNTGVTNITLPSATATSLGWRIKIWNNTASAITITRQGSNRIDGINNNYSLSAGASFWFQRTNDAALNFERYP